MLRGLYTATAGMTSDMAALDLIANNVANTNAIGYKSDFELLVRRSANPLSYGMGGLVVGTGVLQVQQSLDLSQGALNQTGRPFDLALQGPGMFAVQAPNGTVTYVRDGRFHLTAQRQLANDAGQLALSPSGQPIQLPDSQGATYDIKTDGTVNVNNGAVGQIGVFNAPGGWQKSGNGLFAPVGTAQAITTTPIRQGMVENANIDLVRTMGTMMSVQRSYEASSQLQHAEDQLLQQGANDVGRITG